MKKVISVSIIMLLINFSAYSEVIDSAGMFSSSAVSSANQKLNNIKSKSGKELVIETVEEIGQKDANQFALEKAKARKVNGVYVLISKKDRKLKVEVGNNTMQVFGEFERSTLKSKITEEFKNKNFDGGLDSSVDYFAGVMQSAVSNKRGSSTHSNYPQRSETPVSAHQRSGGTSWMTIIIFAVLAFVAFKIITSLMGAGRSGSMGGNGQPYGAGSGYGGGSGPGFMGTFLTGMLGAAAGSWLYDKFTGHDSGLYGNDNSNSDNYGAGSDSWRQSDSDYSSDSSDSGGSDWGGGDSGGSDW